MKEKMTADRLAGLLAEGDIVPLAKDVWLGLADSFPQVDDVDTFMSGRILLVRRPVPGKNRQGWAIVEDPAPSQKVIRPMDNAREARALIADRLAAYERMWDG